MTFKHVKFEDSPTMRALERVAKEKGLVKPEPLKKTAAAKKPNYTPSSDLMENILTLCAGLRNQGFEKEASELENNYLMYKQAQTLYETSKETGEDLVQSAHPKGSHRLENVEGDEAVVEDILDQHMKMLEKVNKTPNGKLVSNAQLISEVKKALGGVAEFTASQLAGGPWGRLMSLLGRGGAIELAAPGVGAGGAAVGAGETAAAGGAAVGGAALASVVGAVLIGAVGGAIIGNELFDHYLAPDELKDAGEKLIEKAKDLQDSHGASGFGDQDLPEAFKDTIQNFELSFNKILENYSVIQQLEKTKNPGNLVKLKQLDDELWRSHKFAQTIWGFAQSAIDEKWYRIRWMPAFNPFADLVALAKNYMDRTNTLTSLISKFVSDANAIASEKLKQQTVTKGGDDVVNLQNAYKALAGVGGEIDKYKSIIQAKRMSNAQALSNWLEKARTVVNSESADFNKVPDANKPSVVKYYSDRLNNQIKPKIKAFADKWMA